MSDIESNIKVNIDTTGALASIKVLQAQISEFHTRMAKSGAAANRESQNIQQNLINSVNASGKFSASMQTIRSTTESFTTALEKNKLSMGQYFKYSIASTKSFGQVFKTEFETINKVARERVKDLQTQYIKMGRDANGSLKAIAVRPLMLDMDNLGTKTAIAAQRQQLLNQLLKQGSTNLLNFGKNTQWAGRQLMVGFTIPLTMAGAAATKAYMDIERSSVAFKRVYGDINTTAKQANDMAMQVQGLAASYTKYGVAVADTMDMAAKAAAMGKTGADLLSQIDQATKLSVLGGVDQQQALDTTISLTNAFGVSADQLTQKINFLNSVENQTVLSIEDMTTAIPKAAPVIKQLGGNVEDLAFFLTAMREGGVNASEGANALKSGLASLINPTKAASEFLQGFGINVKAIVNKDKGDLKKTVLDFAGALNTLDPLNRAKAIEMMFGKFQFARISTLFKNITDSGSQASKVIGLAAQSPMQLAMTANKELQKVQSSPMYKFQKALADIQLKIAPIGASILKIVTPIIDFAGKMLNAFNHMNDGFKNFVLVGSAIGGIVAPALLMVVGLVANGAANILKFFTMIKTFFNKTTSASQNLGEQTSYLTTKQLKAEAVAASLDQVHGKLRQTFTSEAQSVDLLTAAYERSVAAQRAFSGPILPFRGPGKKFATGGIISGPGTGTSDSIVARVSNGEAIIPAKSVARHPDLVSALVSGNIPGFATGASKINKSHLQGALDPNNPEVKAQILQLFPNWDKMPKAMQDKMIFSGSLTAELPNVLNQRLKSKNGADTKTFSSAWSAVDDKMLSTAISGGLDSNNPDQRKALKNIEISIGKRAAELAKKAGTGVTDAILASATDEILKESKATGGTEAKVAKILESRKNVVGDYRGKFTKKEYSEMLQNGSAVMRGQQIVDAATGAVLGDERRSLSGNNKTGYSQKAQKVGKFGGYNSQKNMSVILDSEAALMTQASADNKKQKESSKKTTEAKEKTAKISIKRTAEEQKAYDAMTAQQKAADTRARKTAALQEKSVKNTEEAVKEEVQVRQRRRASSPQMTVGGSQSGTRTSRRAIRPGDLEARLAEEARWNAQGMADQPLGPAKPNFMQRVQSRVSNSKPVKAYSKMGTGAKFGIGMAANAAVGVASMMPGPVGNIANSIMPIVSTISMIAPILSSFGVSLAAVVPFIPGIGAAALAIGGLVLLSNALADAKKKELADTNALSDGLNLSAKKSKALSSIMGEPIKTAGSGARIISDGLTAKNFNEVTALKKSKEFKSAYGNTANKLKTMSVGDSETYIKNLATNLLAGGTSKRAVQTIVDAIRSESGKTTFKIDVNKLDLSTKGGQAAYKNGLKNVFKNIQKTMTDFSKSSDSLKLDLDMQRKFNAYQQSGGTNSFDRFIRDQMRNFPTYKKEFKNLGAEVQSSLASITSAYKNHQIDYKTFNKDMDELQTKVLSLKSLSDQKIVISSMLDASGMDSKSKLAVKSIKSVQDQLLILKAFEAGVITKGEIAALGQKTQYQGSVFSDPAGEARKKIEADMKALGVVNDLLNGKKGSGAGGTGGAGGTKTDPYASILTSLKNIYSAAIKAGGGFKELNRIISGGRGINPFKGIESQLAAKGYNPEFISFVTGLDAAEQKRFITIKNGTVVLTKYGKVMSQAYNLQTISSFINSQKQNIQNFKDEVIVKNELIKAGIDNAKAQELANNADLRAAYIAAMSIKNTKLRKQALEELNNVIKQNIEITNQQAAADAAASTAATPPPTLQEAFGNVMSLVNQYFSAEKNAIELKFKPQEDAQQQIIDAAQKVIDTAQSKIDAANEKINTIQDRVDLYNRDLEKIQEQEDALNKTYDAQSKALADLKTANDQLAQSKKSRLTIADALSQGNIAEAAKAAQDMRAQQAGNSIDNQQKALDKAHQAALDAITVNGKTRVQIDAEIKALNEQIYQIQQSQIKPQEAIIAAQEKIIKAANDQLKILNDQKIAQEKALTLLGKTEDQWAGIQSAIDIAALSGDAFNNKLIDMINNTEGLAGLLAQLGIAIPGVSASSAAQLATTADTSSASGTGGVGKPSMLLMSTGGMVPSYFASGGYSRGTDTVPAMLTPGEFVVKKYAVDDFGVENLKAINSGTYEGNSVYNYNININAGDVSDPDRLARVVMDRIRQVDSQKMRGNRF